MAAPKLTKAERDEIEAAVAHFVQNRDRFSIVAKSLNLHLRENHRLAKYIHFIKHRVKEPENLREKLIRKAVDAKKKGRKPSISAANLFRKVTDLAGVRILHLHTEQIREMSAIITDIFDEHRYEVIEGPTAICWDREYEELFRTLGVKPQSRASMYTSVHYIVKPKQRTLITAELQVRTLMEEVWGEVSHRVKYPTHALNRAGTDQLKVLARMTSGCTRLVDSIFRSAGEQ